jgi:hypothetical protein
MLKEVSELELIAVT